MRTISIEGIKEGYRFGTIHDLSVALDEVLQCRKSKTIRDIKVFPVLVDGGTLRYDALIIIDEK